MSEYGRFGLQYKRGMTASDARFGVFGTRQRFVKHSGTDKEDGGHDSWSDAECEHGVGEGVVVIEPADLRSVTLLLPEQAGFVDEDTKGNGCCGRPCLWQSEQIQIQYQTNCYYI